MDLKRATVVVEEERGEKVLLFLGERRIWEEKGWGLSLWINNGCSPFTKGFAVSSIV